MMTPEDITNMFDDPWSAAIPVKAAVDIYGAWPSTVRLAKGGLEIVWFVQTEDYYLHIYAYSFGARINDWALDSEAADGEGDTLREAHSDWLKNVNESISRIAASKEWAPPGLAVTGEQ